jgi:hypothetical protein
MNSANAFQFWLVSLCLAMFIAVAMVCFAKLRLMGQSKKRKTGISWMLGFSMCLLLSFSVISSAIPNVEAVSLRGKANLDASMYGQLQGEKEAATDLLTFIGTLFSGFGTKVL